ncbi:MAG: hypothetical protein HZC41_06025 [Chloroflexi bacterium]|nr:hypothetical protein [Chloroflexota bacterium]
MQLAFHRLLFFHFLLFFWIEANRLQTVWRLLLIALVGLLAACGAATATPTVSPAPDTNAGASTQPTEDITLVGQTGRPQFLDSFAHW